MLKLDQIKNWCVHEESNRLDFKRNQYLCEMFGCHHSEEENAAGKHKKGSML
jgi:hypothetical protein